MIGTILNNKHYEQVILPIKKKDGKLFIFATLLKSIRKRDES